MHIGKFYATGRAAATLFYVTTPRAMLRFRRMRSLQIFAAVHSSVYNHFNQEHHVSSRNVFKLNRAAALAEWRQLGAA